MKPYQYLSRILRHLGLNYGASLVAWAMLWASALVPGQITRAFFDRLATSGTAEAGLWGLAALLAGFSLARMVIILLAAAGSARCRSLTFGLLMRNMLGRLLELPGAAALPEAPGAVISRFRDDTKAAVDVMDWTLDLPGMLIFAVVALWQLARINARVTVLVFLPLVAVLAVTRLATSRLQRVRGASREATARVTGALGEVFSAVSAIKLAGAEAEVTRHLQGLGDIRRKLMLKDRLYTQLVEAVVENTVSLGTGLILLLVGESVGSSHFTVGDFSLFVYYLTFVTDFTSFVGRFATHYRLSAVSFGRMTALMQGMPPVRLVEAEPTVQPAPDGVSDPLGVLTVSGLTCLHPSSGRGITGADLRIERGTFTVITGRVGSGKSTLLRGLLGLLPAQGGELRWNGRPVTHPGTWMRPPRLAYTPQIPSLFSATLRENLLLGAPAGEASLANAIATAVMEPDLAEMANGLETEVGTRGLRLSGGQIQRAAAARMLLRQAELLVVDDLSSAVDVETEQLLWERVLALPGRTVLAVSHRPAVLRRADQIVVLDEGRVVDQGRLPELLARCPAMQLLWQMGPVRP